MNLKHYEDFINYQNRGLKAKAKESLNKFIVSFSEQKDVAQWVWSYLSEFNPNHTMRHEILEHLEVPVLLEGYGKKEFRSILWLGRLIEGLGASKVTAVYKKIGLDRDHSFFKECYGKDPGNLEVIECILRGTVNWFEYCQHEWPYGIVYRANGAAREECKKIRQELNFAREIDKEAKYAEFFRSFEEKLDLYESRLTYRLDFSVQ